MLFLVLRASAFEKGPADEAIDPFAGLERYSDEFVRNHKLRSLGVLKINNRRGDVTVRNWTQDKIRIQVYREAFAKTELEAKQLAERADVDVREFGNQIEIFARYGKGLEIGKKLEERSKSMARLSFVIDAPHSVNLELWTVSGAVAVKGWRGEVSIRSTDGEVEVSKLRGGNLQITCTSCPISLSDIESKVRIVGGKRDIRGYKIRGESLYFQSESGSLEIQHASGNQVYVSKSGDLIGKGLQGNVQFRTETGNIQIKKGNGFVSGKTTYGNIDIEMLSWKFQSKGLIESLKGNVNVILPKNFSGELDIESHYGKVVSEFVVRKRGFGKRIPVVMTENRIRGEVGEGGEQLRIQSTKGMITVHRGHF